jgi:hypothetical protein
MEWRKEFGKNDLDRESVVTPSPNPPSDSPNPPDIKIPQTSPVANNRAIAHPFR